MSSLEKLLVKFNDNESILEIYDRTGRYNAAIELLVTKFDDPKKLGNYLLQRQSLLDNQSSIDEMWCTVLNSVNNNINAAAEAAAPVLLQTKFKITNEWVVGFMAMSLGSSQCLQVLNQFVNNITAENENAVFNLNPDMYRKLSDLAQSEITQNKLKHDLLESVDSYMWSEKSNALSLPVRAVLQCSAMPQNKDTSNKWVMDQMQNSFRIIKANSLNFEHGASARYLEDSSLHWGIEIQGKQPCPRCRLPLYCPPGSANAQFSKSDIIVFKCGHAYHRACCTSEACVKCHAKNFSSIVPQNLFNNQ